MIDKQENRLSSCCLYNIMEQCSRQCIRRTFFAVMIGVSPIVICLVLIGLARLILNRLEIVYYRRQKGTDRRLTLGNLQSGRLALSYTPVSNAELQRIIQGEYQSRQTQDSCISVTSNSINTRKTPRFIKSILPRREPALPTASILANLVIRRDALDATPMTAFIAPMEAPLQPTFSIVNEQEKRRPSVITIKRESVETTTSTNNSMNNNSHLSGTNELVESKPIPNDSLMTSTKTMTTTTVVVEEFLEFHSAGSLPCPLSLRGTVADEDDDGNSEINYDHDEP